MLGAFNIDDPGESGTSITAIVMFVIFQVVVVVITLNLLIAVMTEAYQRVGHDLS